MKTLAITKRELETNKLKHLAEGTSTSLTMGLLNLFKLIAI
jgi:hypothetical protein